jgi:trypsin
MNRIYLIVLFCIKSIFATTYTCDPTVSCGCSLASTVVSARIAGGQAAANSSWGWAVSFQRLESHICGGSLISDEFAVTAAHCINEIYSISEFSIVVGTNYILNITDTAAQRRQLIDYFIHPDFDIVTLENDIALVRFLPVSIPSNSTVSIICLPADDQDPFAIGSNLVAIGWGTLNDSIRVAYPYLEQVTLQAYSPTSNQCVQSNFMNATTQICAGVVAGGKGMVFD